MSPEPGRVQTYKRSVCGRDARVGVGVHVQDATVGVPTIAMTGSVDRKQELNCRRCPGVGGSSALKTSMSCRALFGASTAFRAKRFRE